MSHPVWYNPGIKTGTKHFRGMISEPRQLSIPLPRDEIHSRIRVRDISRGIDRTYRRASRLNVLRSATGAGSESSDASANGSMDIAVSPHLTHLRPHLPTQETDRFKYTEPPPRPPYLNFPRSSFRIFLWLLYSCTIFGTISIQLPRYVGLKGKNNLGRLELGPAPSCLSPNFINKHVPPPPTLMFP